MKYSVIVPVYNAEKFIQRCINSVLSDSRDDLEIIVVNDGSLDNSLEIIEKIASTDLRVKVHSQKNRGVSSARNYGIEKASGEWLTFLDSDDFYVTSPFHMFDEILESEKSDIIRFGCTSQQYVRMIEHRKELFLATLQIRGEENCFYNNHFASACYALYNAQLIKKNGVKFDTDLVMGEDMFFNLEYISCSKTMYLSTFDFYNYTNNEESATKKLNTKIPVADHIFQYKLLDLLNKNGYSDSNDIFYKSVLQGIPVCCNTCFHRYNLMDYKKAKKSFLDLIKQEPYCSALEKMNCKGLNFYNMLVLFGAKHQFFFPGYILRKAATKIFNKS